MDRSSVTEQFVRTVGTFALVGPLVGVAVVWICLAVQGVFARGFPLESGAALVSLSGSILGALVVSLVVGYVIGIIPAAVTGVACHFFAKAVRSDTLWVVLCTAMGALGGGATAAVMGGGQPDGASLAMLSATGAIAAAVCGFKLRRARWA